MRRRRRGRDSSRHRLRPGVPGGLAAANPRRPGERATGMVRPPEAAPPGLHDQRRAQVARPHVPPRSQHDCGGQARGRVRLQRVGRVRPDAWRAQGAPRGAQDRGRRDAGGARAVPEPVRVAMPGPVGAAVARLRAARAGRAQRDPRLAQPSGQPVDGQGARAGLGRWARSSGGDPASRRARHHVAPDTRLGDHRAVAGGSRCERGPRHGPRRGHGALDRGLRRGHAEDGIVAELAGGDASLGGLGGPPGVLVAGTPRGRVGARGGVRCVSARAAGAAHRLRRPRWFLGDRSRPLLAQLRARLLRSLPGVIARAPGIQRASLVLFRWAPFAKTGCSKGRHACLLSRSRMCARTCDQPGAGGIYCGDIHVARKLQQHHVSATFLPSAQG
mmetsp:Transcript_112322/g.312183  ORF Transcript_112322/g.312183 Transcript_112322/m.312183 type:complete len:388 (-) Transcript_112322:74-1237(-)